MEFKEGICKFCLEKREHCRDIDKNTTNVLSELLPKTDFTAIQRQVICRNCAEMLIKCYDFKAKCLHTYEFIVPLVNKNSVNLDLKDAYLSNNTTGTGVPEDQDVCGFCTDLVKNVSDVSLVMLEMIKRCLPELDLSNIEKLVICASCLGSLENCFHFLTNCLIAEEKIRKYRDTLDIDCKGEIELSNVLQLTDVTSEVDSNSVNKIKVEQEFCVGRKSPDQNKIDHKIDIIKLEETFLDDCVDANEDVKIKNEIFIEMNNEKGGNELRFTSKSILSLEEESYRLGFIKTEGLFCEENEAEHKEENLGETEDQKCFLREEIQIETEENNFSRFEDSITPPQQEVASRFHREQKCLMSNVERDQTKLYVKEAPMNNNVPAKTILKCNICLFQTKHKYSLKRHLLTHKDSSEVPIYQCDLCLYETKDKCCLRRHMLKHKNPSEVTIYKCEFCSYQINHKDSLKKHLLKHMDLSAVTMYKCDFCLHQTKYKNYFKRHLLKHDISLNLNFLKHKDTSEVSMYKCDSCSYQSRFKSGLRVHLQKHKDPAEVTVYKCDSCLYQTKIKGDFKRHLLRHKYPSEVTMYKCDSCPYQAIHKHSIKVHSLKHKDPSEVTTYKCDSCSFQTKFKHNLKPHMLQHKDPSEVTMHKCHSCLYQTRFKDDLKKHLPRHKNPSEMTMYKCEFCSYQAKYKHHLKSHLLKHQDSSEVTIFKCYSCAYQTKYKYSLKVHLLKHGH